MKEEKNLNGLSGIWEFSETLIASIINDVIIIVNELIKTEDGETEFVFSSSSEKEEFYNLEKVCKGNFLKDEGFNNVKNDPTDFYLDSGEINGENIVFKGAMLKFRRSKKKNERKKGGLSSRDEPNNFELRSSDVESKEKVEIIKEKENDTDNGKNDVESKEKVEIIEEKENDTDNGKNDSLLEQTQLDEEPFEDGSKSGLTPTENKEKIMVTNFLIAEETHPDKNKEQNTLKKVRTVSFADEQEIIEERVIDSDAVKSPINNDEVSVIVENNAIVACDWGTFEEIDLTSDKTYVPFHYVDDGVFVMDDLTLNEKRTSFQNYVETEELSETCTLGDESEEGDLEGEEQLRRENILALKAFDNIWSSRSSSRSNSDPHTSKIPSAEIQTGLVRSVIQQFENTIHQPQKPSKVCNCEISKESISELKNQIGKMVDDYKKGSKNREDAAVQVDEIPMKEMKKPCQLKFYIGDDSENLDKEGGIDNTGFEDYSVDSGVDEGCVSDINAEVSGPVTDKLWRCTWPEHVSTALSILSLAGTLGNLIRLPRMVYFHGGGIFLLVYILVTLLFGIPLTFLEVGLGQFCQHGTVKMWRAVNLFRGVGYAKVFLSFAAAVYYSVQVSTALALLTWTAKGPLPFSECNFLNENGSRPLSAPGEQCLKSTFLSPVELDPMGFGIVLLFLLVVWALVVICVLKRSATYRRAMYFLFPGFFALLAALLVEASSRTSIGIDRLFTFEWQNLADVQVWYFATVQMFFSLQIGFGNINTCAGRIYPKSNAFWTALCLVMANLVMGIAAVCLTYLWIGQIEEKGLVLPSSRVPELFVLALIYDISSTCIENWASLWAIIAYVLVFGAGLSSLIVFIYTVLVAVAIETKRKWHWWHVNAMVCFIACILAILSLIPSYQSIPHILDHYVVSRGVVFLTILELIGFAMVYGCSNLYNDLEFVIGKKLSSAWRSLWIVTPFVLIIIEVCSANLLPLDGESPYHDDEWEYGLGWALYFICWLIVLGCAIHQIWVQVDFDFIQKLKSAVKPSRNWGPVDPIYRHCWVQWRNRYNLTGTRDFTLKRRGTRDYTHHARTAAPDSVSHSFDIGGVHPSGDWAFKRPTSTPVKNDYASENIYWKKPEVSKH